MKYIHVSFFCFVVMLFMATAASAEQFVALAFGDSITQGLQRNASGSVWGVTSPQYGSRLGDTNGNQGYEPVIEKLVSEDDSKVDTTLYVYNWGYQGERTTTGIVRISRALNSRAANFILIMEGANDLYQGLSPYTTKFNIGIMAEKSLAKGVMPIIGGVTPNTDHNSGDWVWRYYFPFLRDIALEKEVPFVDMYTPFEGTYGQIWPAYNSGDGLHLNSAGYRFMAQLWYQELEKLLAQMLVKSRRAMPWVDVLLLRHEVVQP